MYRCLSFPVVYGPGELLVLWSSSVAVTGWRTWFSDRTSAGPVVVIDEAGAARTPVLQYAQEGNRGKPIDFRIGNEPETLAVDEKLCAELADVETNP